MKPRLLFFLMLTLILPPLILSAQESTPEATSQPDTEGWPIVQRCVGEPTTPPDEWTYDGTIFTYTQDQGVRALRADQPTTYFIAFNGENFNEAGAFSPDGRWYAVPAGIRRSIEESFGDYYWEVNKIRVFSTSPSNELMVQISWSAVFRGSRQTAVQRIMWINNEQFIYSDFDIYGRNATHLYNINPFSGEIQRLEGEVSIAYFDGLSPDGTRTFIRFHSFRERRIELLNIADETSVLDLSSQDLWFLGWLPDSSGLLLSTYQEDYNSIIYMDNNGRNTETIFAASFSRENISDFRWSSDSRKFVGRIEQNGEYSLFIGDTVERVIIDLCITARWPQWSPDSTHLVFVSEGIQILDLDNYDRYAVASDIGIPIAWRAGE